MKKSELIEKWMMVWNSNRDKAIKRFVVRKLHDGRYSALDCRENITHYLNGDNVSTECWNNAKPLPKKVTRQMTHEEIFELMQNEMRKGNLVLFKSNIIGDISTNWHSGFRSRRDMHKYSTDLGKTWHKLEKEEVQQ